MIINNPAMNICVQVFYVDLFFIPPGNTPRSTTGGSHGKSMFNFLRNTPYCPPILQFHHPCTRDPSFPHPRHTLFVPVTKLWQTTFLG